MSGFDTSNVYYNVRIFNESAEPTRAEFNETRPFPILTNPDNYEISVVRFNIPTSTIPIFIFDEGAYTVSLQFGNTVQTEPLVFIPNGRTLYGNAVYSYQEITDLLQAAFSEAFRKLKLLEPSLPGEFPEIAYETDSQTYSIYVDKSWNDTLGPKPRIFLNETLYNFFRNSLTFFTSSTLPPDQKYELIYNRQFDNEVQQGGVTYLKQRQAFSTVGIISTFSDIILATRRIPVVGEYLNSPSGGSKNVTQQILTDFQPAGGGQDSSGLQFFPSGPLRYYALEGGHSELRELDLQVLWEDNKRRQFPLFLAPGEFLTVKIKFRNKKYVLCDGE